MYEMSTREIDRFVINTMEHYLRGSGNEYGPNRYIRRDDIVYQAQDGFFHKYGNPVKDMTLTFQGPTLYGKPKNINAYDENKNRKSECCLSAGLTIDAIGKSINRLKRRDAIISVETYGFKEYTTQKCFEEYKTWRKERKAMRVYKTASLLIEAALKAGTGEHPVEALIKEAEILGVNLEKYHDEEWYQERLVEVNAERAKREAEAS